MGEDAETVRVWLVERSYGADEDLVTLVYATTDGKRHFRKQLSHNMLWDREITAAREVDPDRLEAVPAGDREQFADEASRMAQRHDPDDTV
jgi:hypothetical protein